MAVITFLYSCSSWSGTDIKMPDLRSHIVSKQQDDTTNVVLFKVNGDLVRTSGWNIGAFVRDNATNVGLNITTNMHEDKRTILMNLNGTTPGIYRFSKDHHLPDSYGHYKPDYTGDLFYSYSFVSGAFNLSEVDIEKKYINATFWGTVQDNAGKKLEITDGKIIHGTLTKWITKPVADVQDDASTLLY